MPGIINTTSSTCIAVACIVTSGLLFLAAYDDITSGSIVVMAFHQPSMSTVPLIQNFLGQSRRGGRYDGLFGGAQFQHSFASTALQRDSSMKRSMKQESRSNREITSLNLFNFNKDNEVESNNDKDSDSFVGKLPFFNNNNGSGKMNKNKSTRNNQVLKKNRNDNEEEEVSWIPKIDLPSPISEVVEKVQDFFALILEKMSDFLPQPIIDFIDKLKDILPTLRTISLSFIAGAVISVSALIFPVFSDGYGNDKMTQPVTLFETILSDLDRGYVDKVDTEKLFETAMTGMLKSLDPYTEFEGKKEAQEMQESVSGKYGGVGLVISGSERTSGLLDEQKISAEDKEEGNSFDILDDEDDDISNIKKPSKEKGDEELEKMRKRRFARAENLQKRGIRVISAFEGYAYDAGMRAGDKILAVDDLVIKDGDTSVEDVRNRLRGTPGTVTQIKVQREGVGELTVSVPRTLVKLRDVKLASMVVQPNVKAGGVGYIQLSGFSANAGAEVRGALRKLQAAAETGSDGRQTLDGLILDMRSNPGGLLTQAVDVASILVPKNSDIVSARGRGFPGVLYRTGKENPLLSPTTKLVVLVNGNTASAAEIVSGAVQDLDVGVVLGADRTFGKGLVQNVEELPFETALKYTVAKYYTPSGRCIQSTNYKEGGGTDSKNSGFTSTKVKESEKQKFFTKAGRVVSDGGGVEADVKVEMPKASALEVTLLRSGLMADYAASWSRGHELPNTRFEINDDTYADFRKFVLQKQKSEEIDLLDGIYNAPIAELSRSLKLSGYNQSLKQPLKELQQSILRDMERDFDKYRDDLKEDLANNILVRYLPESMIIDRSIQKDVQVKAAIKLMKNDDKFNTILARKVSGGKNVAEQALGKSNSLSTATSEGKISPGADIEDAGIKLNMKF